MINHLFFDLDNTLWDHRKNAELTLVGLFKQENIQQKYGLQFDEFYKEYYTVNEDLWAKIRNGSIDKAYLRSHRFLDTFRAFEIDNAPLAALFESRFLDEILQYNELVPGTFELLEYLSEKKYTMHILSNGFEEVTARKCELSGIKSYFKTITSADEIDIRKPDPKLFQWAFEKTDARVENSIYIGDDWIADVEGALNFGMRAIFLDVFEDRYTAPGVEVVRSLHEIKDLL
ncbi:YjjG family noncanonical pyrimidine nucleotidase [Chryseobacterium sp. A301]